MEALPLSFRFQEVWLCRQWFEVSLVVVRMACLYPSPSFSKLALLVHPPSPPRFSLWWPVGCRLSLRRPSPYRVRFHNKGRITPGGVLRGARNSRRQGSAPGASGVATCVDSGPSRHQFSVTVSHLPYFCRILTTGLAASWAASIVFHFRDESVLFRRPKVSYWFQ